MWEADFRSDDKSEIKSSHDGLEDLLTVIATTQEHMLELQETISGFPRLTSSFNKAKRQAAQSLAGLNRALSSAHNLTTQAVMELKRILGDTSEGTENQ
jgi:ABC-type transporter Mla subunit MlaD